MKDSNSKQGRHFLSYTHKDEILVDDIIQQLTGLAKLQSQEKTGNAAFGAGLLHLVDALRPYANSPVAELPAMLRKFPPRRNSKPSHRCHPTWTPLDWRSWRRFSRTRTTPSSSWLNLGIDDSASLDHISPDSARMTRWHLSAQPLPTREPLM